MSNLLKYVPLVNEQAAFHEHMAKKFAYDKRRSDKHSGTASWFRQLIADIESPEDKLSQVSTLPATVDPVPQPQKKIQLDLSYDEVQGLPSELIQELSVSEGDKVEFAILKTIRELGGVASLDRILVGIYKETNEIIKRTTLTSRVYRMSQKGLVFSVPNRKGAYSLRELTQEEAAAIIA